MNDSKDMIITPVHIINNKDENTRNLWHHQEKCMQASWMLLDWVLSGDSPAKGRMSNPPLGCRHPGVIKLLYV